MDMKKQLILLLAALMTLTFATASAQTVAIGGADGPTSVYLSGDASATLTLQGSASVTLQPDHAQMTFGVRTSAEQIAGAQAANNQRMEAVFAALEQAGVAEGDIHTSGYNVSPIYDYDYGKLTDQQLMKGYEVSNTVSVTVRALDSVGAVLDAALSAGATESYGLNYLSDKAADAYDAALKLAVADAARKAALLAEAAGLELGALRDLAETPDVSYAYANTQKSVAMDAAAGAVLAPGELTVTANIQATYTFK